MPSRRSLARAGALLFLALLGACTSAPILDVSLRTDMPGGVEFDSIRTEIRRDSGEVVRAAEVMAQAPADWTRPRRVAELGDLPAGDLLLNVALFRSGAIAAQRTLRVTLGHDRVALTVLITRDCRGVVCPGTGGDPRATTCLGGRCVSPECNELNPSACPPPICMVPRDCPMPVVSCADAACAEGACISVPNDRCAATEYCDLVDDCRPVLAPRDAGPGDGGVDASTSSCTEGLPCDTGDVCSVGQTRCVLGVPECMATGPAAASTVCRPAAGACDVAETCGGAVTCPTDVLAGTTTQCRASTGECDAAETCTGASVDCPLDRAADDGTVCSLGVCNVGTCIACRNGLPCSTSRACERGMVDCAGSMPTCVGAGPLSAGQACRDAAGVCDAPEACDGSGLDCPPDGFLPSTASCRGSSGPCDVAETCSGTSAACSTDGFAASSVVCRPASGACDVDDRCSGTSAACTGDLRRGAGFVCRPALDVCDVVDVCDGASTACGPDAVVAAGTTCRAMMGLCDAVEACDGTHVGCPVDGYRSSGAACRASVGACDATESCNGGSPACPADRSVPDGTACPGGVCSSGACAPCTAGGSCMTANACERGVIDCSSGSAVCVPSGPLPSGTQCRLAAGPCDRVEACDGSGLGCPTDGFLSGVVCRSASGSCDIAETCSGASASCPANLTQPDGTDCGTTMCGGFGPCMGAGCNFGAPGTQTQTCMTPVCSGGSCGGTRTDMPSQSCTRSDACGDTCCHGDELGDTCPLDCGSMPTGITTGPIVYGPVIGPPVGIAFEDMCPADMVIVALYFDYFPDMAGTVWMEGAGAYCAPLLYSRAGPPAHIGVATGGLFATPARGGNGWTTVTCSAGDVTTGMSASLSAPSTYVRAVDMHCSTPTVVGNENTAGTHPTFTYASGDPQLIVCVQPIGAPAGTLIPADCPPGTVARGIRGSYDPIGLSSYGLVCQAIAPR